jgi:geranylgeranyl reductase family protein
MPDRFDVIISGGGPAGALAAYTLACQGVDVQLFEKQLFPRYKVCGAGLTHKIIREIPYDVQPVVETTVRKFLFSRKFEDVFERESGEPLIYCTMRDTLDQFLLDKAASAGARITFGEQVTGIFEEKDAVTVTTRKGKYSSKLVIGADGASGTVTRAVGLKRDFMQGLAWEAELDVDNTSLERFSQHVFLDWGSFPGGYGWMFPKQDHFSVGVGGPASLSKHMMDYYQQFLHHLKNQGVTVNRTRSLKSWPIPVKERPGRFSTSLVMVTGDAAGLTDPLTGEGIYYAVKSGILAGEAAVRFLKSKDSLNMYSQNVNNLLMPELQEAMKIRNIFNTVPERIHHFVRDHDRAWRAFARILRGERNYLDVKNGFGKWKPLWTAASAVSGAVSSYRERKFRKAGF